MTVRLLLVLLIALVAADAGATELRFIESGARLAAGHPSTMAVGIADFNGDGRSDIVMSAYGSPAAIVYENQGGATFAPRQAVGAWGWHRSLATGDVDGDGDADFAVADIGSITLYVNRGDATFEAGASVGTGGSLNTDICLTDLDRDGDLDLVSSGTYGGSLLVWLNDGTGAFTATEQVLPGSRALAVADLDGDGDPDLVDTFGQVALNDGMANFTPAGTWFPATYAYDGTVRAADVNGDGLTDVITQETAVYLNLGGGTFVPVGRISDRARYARFELGDLDGDGDLDIAARLFEDDNFHSHETELFVNDGTGRFAHGGQIVVPAEGWMVYTLALGELDGQPGTDLLLGRWGAPSLVFLNRSDSTPPVITASVTGQVGGAGWYTSDVQVSWSVSDPESPVTEHSGCETVTVTADTTGTAFTCRATSRGGVASHTVVIRRDTTPPLASCAVSPAVLWPPNRKMVAVTATASSSDTSSTANLVSLRATSSEPDSGLGDGDQANDIQGFAMQIATAGLLRAERAGTGPGRLYSLVFTIADEAGNMSTCTSHVSVPHDSRRR